MDPISSFTIRFSMKLFKYFKWPPLVPVEVLFIIANFITYSPNNSNSNKFIKIYFVLHPTINYWRFDKTTIAKFVNSGKGCFKRKFVFKLWKSLAIFILS